MRPRAPLFLMGMFAVLSINGGAVATAAPFFQDSFETGDLLTTNSEGFRWDAYNATSIVTQSSTQGNVLVNDGSNVNMVVNDGRNWTAYDGKDSMRFRYAAGAYESEQRFDFGKAHPDLWVSYMLRVPTNYTNGTMNRKFFSLWMDGYDTKGDGATVIWEFWPDTTGSQLSFHISPGSYQPNGPHLQYTHFITLATDLGRWMQVVLHVRASSSGSTADGLVQTYLRWSNQTTFTKVHELTNVALKLPASGPQGWQRGFIMGWANDGYPTNTEWLMDKIQFSDQSLLSGTTTDAVPKPPTDVSVN